MNKFGPISLALASAMLCAGCSNTHEPATKSANHADDQSEDWITLLSGDDIGQWNQIGDANWRAQDGAIVVDSKTTDGAAYLETPVSYADFKLVVEFWASHDANSGIFIRCLDDQPIGDRSCYEANIYDERPDPTYGTGAIVKHAEVDPMPKAGGKWNTYEITAKGRDISLVLNGETTAKIRSGLLSEGRFAVQYGSGTLKFRSVRILPL